MAQRVEETQLPGVGMRYSFTTASGQRVSVLHHRTGHRQIFVSHPDDPDAATEVLDVEGPEARLLAELLGGSQVVADLDRLQHVVPGLALDWFEVEPGSPAAGRSIEQLAVRKTTGVTIVTVLRDGQYIPSPGGELVLQPGDTAVVVGPPEAIRRVNDLLRAP
ncbi:MAG: cation:proton antiporter regulatory subunit [Actinomycetota bacterium]|nr:cation:proton antiporter regulatory subunit [Actinomycetota bacterium]